MANKASDPHKPLSRLDQAIMKLILHEARKLVSQGMNPEDAARKCCHGSWSDFEGYILDKLTEDKDNA